MVDDGDVATLARRAVDAAVRLTWRAALVALAITVVTIVVVLASFLLGIAALDGGIESVWIVIGGFFAVVAIGCSAVATWRVASVRRHAGALLGEMRQLLTRDPDARRSVIETVEVGEAGTGGSIVLSTRGYGSSFGSVVRRQASDFPQLAHSVMAVTTFPLLLFVTAAVTMVFAFLALIFLLALAL